MVFGIRQERESLMPQYKVIEDRENDLAVVTTRFTNGMQMPVGFAFLCPSYPMDDVESVKKNLIEERNPQRLKHLRKLSQQFNTERLFVEGERARQINYVREIASALNDQERSKPSKSTALTPMVGGYLTYGFSTFDEQIPLWKLEDDYKVPPRLTKLLKLDMEFDQDSTLQHVFKTTSLVVTEPEPSSGHDVNFVDIYFAKDHFTTTKVRNAAASVSQKAMGNVQKICSAYMGNRYGVPQISR
jgi:hypothetical protein